MFLKRVTGPMGKLFVRRLQMAHGANAARLLNDMLLLFTHPISETNFMY